MLGPGSRGWRGCANLVHRRRPFKTRRWCRHARRPGRRRRWCRRGRRPARSKRASTRRGPRAGGARRWDARAPTNVPRRTRPPADRRLGARVLGGTRRALRIGARARLFARLGPACSGRARARRRTSLPRARLSLAMTPRGPRPASRSPLVGLRRHRPVAASHAIDRVLAPLMVVAVIGAGLARVGASYVGLVALPTLATHHLRAAARRRGA